MSWFDKFAVPSLEADQRILDATLMVFGHVLMHIRIVFPDVALGAAVWNRPEAKRRGIGVWTLELQGGERERVRVGTEKKAQKLATNSSLGSKQTMRIRMYVFYLPDEKHLKTHYMHESPGQSD